MKTRSYFSPAVLVAAMPLSLLACGPDTEAGGGTGSATGSTSSEVPTPLTADDSETGVTPSGVDTSGSGTVGATSLDGSSTSDGGDTGTTAGSESTGTTTGAPPQDPADAQAMPIVRLRDVCTALDGGGSQRCCMASVCSDDYEEAITCFTDTIQDAAIDGGDTALLDIVFVVDNTTDTASMQRALALRSPQIVTALQGLTTGGGADLNANVNMLVTTTDFGNPLCTPFQPGPPEAGAPVSSACTDRLGAFTSLGGGQVAPEACTDVCPNGAVPDDDFVNFNVGGDNVSDVDVVDIDGDGISDTATSQALACLLPQGLDGCGYEAPLESMLQSLNPGAAWNSGPTPFLRPGANLAVVVLTNEPDCSVQDYSIMQDAALQNTNPATGMSQPSSAICWNAGVTCDGPDGMGVYDNCSPTIDEGLQPITRYTNYLVDQLGTVSGKEVVMLVLGGVSEEGIDATVIHDWVDEDLNMADVAAGVTAADKQFGFGIGPACGGSTR